MPWLPQDAQGQIGTRFLLAGTCQELKLSAFNSRNVKLWFV